MTAEERRCVRAIITGRVQGVWFRAWTDKKARKLDLDGWVRNKRDGSVEAVFAGSDEAVGEMLTACSKGPPAARVEDVSFGPAEDPGSGFHVLPTE